MITEQRPEDRTNEDLLQFYARSIEQVLSTRDYESAVHHDSAIAKAKSELLRRMKRGEHGLTAEEGSLLEELTEAIRAEAFTVYESDGVNSSRVVEYRDVWETVFRVLPKGLIIREEIKGALRAESYLEITSAGEDYFILSPDKAVDIITEIYRKA